MSEHTDRLRRALQEARGADFLSQASRGSLLAAAERDPELRQVAAEFASPDRTELDLHLEGLGVSDHETAAYPFGRFVSRTALTVKELAKAAAGLRRLSARLQVVGPAEGSVRVVFRAPRADDPPNTMTGTRPDTIEATALRRLTALLLQAEHADAEDAPLDASIQRLRGESRRSLRLLGQSVVEADWQLAGVLRQRGQEPVPLAFSGAGAQRLVTAAGTTDAEVGMAWLDGTVDGWIWSEAMMLFQPLSGRRIKVAVDEPLQDTIADLVHRPDVSVTAVLSVVTTYPRGDSAAAQRSYSLESIKHLTQSEISPD